MQILQQQREEEESYEKAYSTHLDFSYDFDGVAGMPGRSSAQMEERIQKGIEKLEISREI